MTIRESMIHSFRPDYFVKVGTMEDGEPEEKLLREIRQPLGKKYDTMMDMENGVIYLKKSSG